MCGLVRCPSCQYEYPEKPQSFTWLQRLFRKPSPYNDLPEHVTTVEELKPGERARVLCLGTGGPQRHNSMAVFGVVPGAEITLVQHHPSPVIQVEETELALDPAIAREVLVERLEQDVPVA
jgi:Fe2+ transport system protein FeoA